MQKHEDGSITLTKQELGEVNEAYQKLYKILNRMPTFIGDYCKDHNEYLRIVKWQCQLAGEEFRREDWE